MNLRVAALLALAATLLFPTAGAATPAAKPAPSARAAAAETYVLQNAVKITAPTRFWKAEVDRDDPTALSLVNKDFGLQIVMRWVANKAQMESQRAAAVLESKLMRADNSTGRQFSFLKRRTIGGLEGSAFTVDHFVDRVGVHRTHYVVVANGGNCLVVAVSGGIDLIEKHKREVDGVLASISFVGALRSAR